MSNNWLYSVTWLVAAIYVFVSCSSYEHPEFTFSSEGVFPSVTPVEVYEGEGTDSVKLQMNRTQIGAVLDSVGDDPNLGSVYEKDEVSYIIRYNTRDSANRVIIITDRFVSVERGVPNGVFQKVIHGQSATEVEAKFGIAPLAAKLSGSISDVLRFDNLGIGFLLDAAGLTYGIIAYPAGTSPD